MMNCCLTIEGVSYSPGRTYFLILNKAIRKTVQIHTALNKNNSHAFKSFNLTFEGVIQNSFFLCLQLEGETDVEGLI